MKIAGIAGTYSEAGGERILIPEPEEAIHDIKEIIGDISISC